MKGRELMSHSDSLGTFIPMNKNVWSRAAYFDHYMNDTICTYNVTANLRITHLLDLLAQENKKLFPALIYMTARILNTHREFKMHMQPDGVIGYFDVIHPYFTHFHKDDETFSDIWLRYCENFYAFYDSYLCVVHRYGNKKGLYSRENKPVNSFLVSCLPWLSFTSVDFQMTYTGKVNLLPLTVFGKYFTQGTEILIPLSIHVHHSVCDGFHTSRFFCEMQQFADNFSV